MTYRCSNEAEKANQDIYDEFRANQDIYDEFRANQDIYDEFKPFGLLVYKQIIRRLNGEVNRKI